MWLDAGARFGGGLFVGAHVSYGFGVLSGAFDRACDRAKSAGTDVRCDVSDVRGGIEFLFLCSAGAEVAIVGGGNSAGQAAVYLSGVASHVHMLVRGPGLAESMSRYLIQRIEGLPKIALRTRCQVVSLEGNDSLENVAWERTDARERETRDVNSLFLMTGADPNTHWLEGCVRLDEKGFVRTGADLLPDELTTARWSMPRRPYLMETSIPGVFCVGDARSNSVKRVASAVGEGSICIQLVHRALEEL